MKYREFRGERLSLYLVLPLLIATAAMCASFAVEVLLAGRYALGLSSCLILLLMALLVSISKLPDDIIVGKSGSVEITLGYVRGAVRWSGTASDLESLTFQTYDTGEGNVNYFVIKIRGKGDVLLRTWDLSEAKELAELLGIKLQEIAVEAGPEGQSRRELIDSLA